MPLFYVNILIRIIDVKISVAEESQGNPIEEVGLPSQSRQKWRPEYRKHVPID